MSSLYSAHARRASPLLTVSIKASVSGEQSFLCPRWHRTKELDTKCKAALSTWGGSTLFVSQKWSDSFLWIRIKMPRQQSYFWLSKRYAFRGSAPLTGRSKKKKKLSTSVSKKILKKRKKRIHFQQRQMLCVVLLRLNHSVHHGTRTKMNHLFQWCRLVVSGRFCSLTGCYEQVKQI